MAKRKRPSADKPGGGRDVQLADSGFSEMDLGERIAWACMHLMLFLVPLAISNLNFLGIGGGLPLTYDQFEIPKAFVMRAAVIVGLGAWLVSRLLRGGRVRRTKADLVLLGVLLWMGLTTFTSVHWPTALVGKYPRMGGLFAYLTFAAALFLTVQLVDRPARLRSLVRTLFFSGVLVTAYGALQYLGVEPVRYKMLTEAGRSFATYGNPDVLGGFLMFLLPMSVSLALSEPRRLRRAAYWSGAALAAVVWVTAFARSAWIGGVVALVLLAVAAWRKRVRFVAEDRTFGAIAALLAIGVAISSLASSSAVLNVGARLASLGSGGAATRTRIWEAALRGIQARPLLGWGLDTFNLVFERYKPASYVRASGYAAVADSAHSYPLQMATSLGIPGMLLLYGLFVLVLVLAFRAAFGREDAPRGETLVFAGVWCAVVGYLVHLSFTLSAPGTNVLLWSALGLLLAASARSVELPKPGAMGAVGAVVVVALGAVLFVGDARMVQADHAYMKAGMDGSLTLEQRLEAAQRAARLYPYVAPYREQVGVACKDLGVASLTGQNGATVDEQRALSWFEQSEKAFKDTLAFDPREYDGYLYITNLYNILGQYYDARYYEKAVAMAERGVFVEPNGPALRVEYARALQARGEPDAALAQLRVATELDPAYADAAMLTADVYESQHQLSKALDALRAVEKADPGQPGVSDRIQSLEASLSAQ